eukprot:scaffold219981_cov19-Tisochrysis_lutea.AAC.1
MVLPPDAGRNGRGVDDSLWVAGCEWQFVDGKNGRVVAVGMTYASAQKAVSKAAQAMQHSSPPPVLVAL